MIQLEFSKETSDFALKISQLIGQVPFTLPKVILLTQILLIVDRHL